MSFSVEWLDLREAADHRARNPELVTTLGNWMIARGGAAHILDLGAGTGSTFRALDEHLPVERRWTFAERDPALAAEARRRHGAEVLEVDLATQLAETLALAPDVVTASALIDLCSARWLDTLADLMPRKAALYMALSYDGRETWSPEPPHERQALAAFHRHQRGDKGFGPALGPDAAPYLAEAMARRGWTVLTADTPWRIGADEATFRHLLADGAAAAVAETGALTEAECAAWHAARRDAQAVSIGHLDLLALPA